MKVRRGDLEWAWMVNLSVQTPNRNADARHPLLVMSSSVGRPNSDVADEAVRQVKGLLNRGHQISRFTTDRGYANFTESLAKPLKELGVPRVTGYKKDQLGVKGGVGGTKQVEGRDYCPETPAGLLEASTAWSNGEIKYSDWKLRIENRRPYEARRKERPDERGHYPMMCPALGPQATVECRWRERHPKASKKSGDIYVDPKTPDDLKPRICCQSSVDFGPDDGVEHEQLLRYGSDEWEATYRHDRNSVESFNDYLKDGPEAMKSAGRRRVRGRTNAFFVVTMMVVQANIRKISRFLLDERLGLAKKKVAVRSRDKRGISEYVKDQPVVELQFNDDFEPHMRT